MLSAHLASKAHISIEMSDDYPEKLWQGGWRAKRCYCFSFPLAIEKENRIKYSKKEDNKAATLKKGRKLQMVVTFTELPQLFVTHSPCQCQAVRNTV